MTLRTEKVSSVVQHVLGQKMQLIELPYLTTILKVEVTSDMKHAKVWISVLPAGEKNEKEILAILKENIYELQGAVNHEMQSKITPRIKFRIDHSEEYSSHISELIQKTHED